MSLTKKDLVAIEELLDRKLEEKLEQKFEEKFGEQNVFISQAFSDLEEQISDLRVQQDETLERIRNIEGHIDALYKLAKIEEDERHVMGYQLTKYEKQIDNHEIRITKLENA
ncbi:MAG: hypothetical protein LBE03_00830 [Candidatus Nomurabacteria bacterium]|jgi:DNA-binding FrmR family transcriptional regulator|nr:hypothetical protein [Candidatus Nomurabacteria bacterium]